MTTTTIKHNFKKGDSILFFGDLFDNPEFNRSKLYNDVCDIFNDVAEICTVIILVGNHDIYERYDNTKNALRDLKNTPNIFVVEHPTEISSIWGQTLSLMPWNHSAELEISVIDKFKEDSFLFCHTFMYGFWYNGQYNPKHIPNTKKKANDIEDFKKFKRVLSGHIHNPQEKANIRFVGAYNKLNFTDANTEDRGIVLLDFADESETFFRNPYSFDFKQIKLKEFIEFNQEKANEYVRNSFVQIYVEGYIFEKFNLNLIKELLVGYIKLEFVRIDTETQEITISNKDIEFNSNVDVEFTIPAYVNQSLIENDLKPKIIDRLKILYDECKMELKQNEINL